MILDDSKCEKFLAFGRRNHVVGMRLVSQPSMNQHLGPTLGMNK